MLGSDVLSVRLGGIYALKRLAEEHPGQYHIQIMELLCAFVRNPKEDQETQMPKRLREDVQAVMTAIGRRGNSGVAIETEAEFRLDLHSARLSYAHLSGLNLARADLSHAKLDNANFFDWRLKRPDLSESIPSGPDQPQVRISLDMEPVGPDLAGMEGRLANLSLASLRGADLSDSWLLGTDLSGADLTVANLRKCEITYANFRMATLFGAKMSSAKVLDSNLSGATMEHAELDNSQFPSTKLYGANLFSASLSGADFSGARFSDGDGKYVVTGLTQEQLDSAKVSPNDAPDLTGVVDVGTGKPLKWSQTSIKDEV